jgi:hypothetical protein
MPAISTLRYADPVTALAYPLAVRGSTDWHPLDGGWRASVSLPDLQAGTILVPSLALQPFGTPACNGDRERATDYRYRWQLEAGGVTWPLQEVPCAVPGPPSAGGAVSTHIDCYHIHRRLDTPRLSLDLLAARVPERYLICASSRALTLAEPPLPTRHEALPNAPTPRSQMTAPAAIATRICSPTCVSMVLDLWQKRHDWLAVVDDCFDPATGMYGVWPLALQAAAKHGSPGAVEVFDTWEAPLDVLARGVPLVTSIRFSPGELPGSPLPETSGHLVVVYGAGPTEVLVCDPAAAAGEVVRSYDARAFSGAWLRHRGAAYILPR